MRILKCFVLAIFYKIKKKHVSNFRKYFNIAIADFLIQLVFLNIYKYYISNVVKKEQRRRIIVNIFSHSY